MHKSKFIIRDLFCLIALLYIPNSDGALLVSEREIEIESEKAWEQMKMSLPISRDLSKRTQVNCIAKKIIRQLDEPFADEDWEIEVFENPGMMLQIFVVTMSFIKKYRCFDTFSLSSKFNTFSLSIKFKIVDIQFRHLGEERFIY